MNVLADRWRNGDKTRISALRIANEYRVGLDTLAQRLTELGMASPEAAARVGSIRPPAKRHHRTRPARNRRVGTADAARCLYQNRA